jgi:hypothetical protein
MEITLKTFQYISRIIYYMYYNKQLILYRQPKEYNSNSITATQIRNRDRPIYSSKRQFENLHTIYIYSIPRNEKETTNQTIYKTKSNCHKNNFK